MAEPLKEVFAEFGFEVDGRVLVNLDAMLEGAVASIDRLANTIQDLAHVFTAFGMGLQGFEENLEKVKRESGKASDEVEELGDEAEAASNGGVKNLGSQLGGLLGKLAALAAGGAAFEWLTHLGREADYTARRLGLTTEQVSTLRAVGRASGVELDNVSETITAFGERMRDAILAPTSDAAEQLRVLGIAVPASTAEMPDSMGLLRTMADALAGIENPAERAAAATTLLGDQGARMLPALEKGARGIDDLERRTRMLGGGLAGPAVDALARFTVAVGEATTIAEGLAGRIVLVIEDALRPFGTDLAEVSAAIFDVIDNTKLLETTLGALTVAVVTYAATSAAAWAVANWPIVLAIAAVTALIAVFADLWEGMEGGKSVIFDFVDGMLGVGATRGIIEGIRLEVEMLFGVLKLVATFLQDTFVPLVSAATGNFGPMLEDIREGGLLDNDYASQLEAMRNNAAQGIGRIQSAQVVQQANNIFRPVERTVAQQNTVSLSVQASPDQRDLANQIERRMRDLFAQANQDLVDSLEEGGA